MRHNVHVYYAYEYDRVAADTCLLNINIFLRG